MSEPDSPKPPFSTLPPRLVSPPFPAPYLAGIPQLPDELLTSERKDLSREDQIKARRIQRQIEQRMIEARWKHEAEHGVQIVPEPPLQP